MKGSIKAHSNWENSKHLIISWVKRLIRSGMIAGVKLAWNDDEDDGALLLIELGIGTLHGAGLLAAV